MNSAQPAALEALCRRLGIAADYEGAWGHRVMVPPAHRRAIAGSMGHGAADEHEAAQSLDVFDRAQAGQVLPPVVVLEPGDAVPNLLAHLPERLANSLLLWSLRLEDGTHLQGSVTPAVADEHAALPGASQVGVRARMLRLEIELPVGYHRLRVFEPTQPPELLVETRLAMCPARCFELRAEPARGDAQEQPVRLWGPVAQLYALRSPRNWGMGDFGDLRRLVDMAADAGANFVGINPLHALFPHDPDQASPYSPSSRRWLNVLYLDVESLREFGECSDATQAVRAAEFQQRLAALREAPMVDYAGVRAVKFEALEKIYTHFRQQHLDRATQRAGLFRDFQREGGKSLRAHALFDTLQEHFHAIDPRIWGWPAWPQPFRDVDGQAAQEFARAHEVRVEFFEYLQWQAELQLEAAALRANHRGMCVGLYRDLAIGVHPGGSEAWCDPTLHAMNAHVGAPPDELNPNGQDWGFPPAIPHRMVDDRFESFVSVLRANMRHAGALRIDHVMGLMRLFWVTGGGSGHATQLTGSYVAYPFEDLVRLVCQESQRHRCVVVGEDLGIVPPQVGQAMERRAILSYRPLYFQQQGPQARFCPPLDWPAQAIAVVCTHDLPTLRGYWLDFDLRQREALGMYRHSDLLHGHFARRHLERAALLDALRDAGLPVDGIASEGEPDPRLAVAVHRYVARTPCTLMGLHLEDVLGQLEQVNVPGASERQYPNWRRKLDLDLQALETAPAWLAHSAAVRGERPPVGERQAVGVPLQAGFQPETAPIPRATYRLQLQRDFRFTDAQATLPYLAALGVSHVYASPVLKAAPGSLHGYDVVDHQAFNPEIGTEAEFDSYCAQLASHGMSLLMDVVPNHMGVMGGVGADNPWWRDLLENGRLSAYADYFDIDWQTRVPGLRDKVLVPVLADQYGTVLESGELRLQFAPRSGEFSVRYLNHDFPVDPSDYSAILGSASAAITDSFRRDESASDAAHPVAHDAGTAALELHTLLAAWEHLPPRDVPEPERQARRRRDQQLFKQHLIDLVERSAAVRAHIAARLQALNGRVGIPSSFDALDALLGRQAYRLASWRTAADDINYRRFFDINGLVALRSESVEVFEATHGLLLRWMAQGCISGVRVDHVDGLADPQAYLQRLQDSHAGARGAASAGAPAPAALYVVVEKILGESEPLPKEWAAHGGTGYRFANVCTGLFVEAANELRLSRIYRSFTGEARYYTDVMIDCRRLIITHALSADLAMLARLAHQIAASDRSTRDFTANRLSGALAELAAGFPVYRTYITERGVSAHDRRFVERALDDALHRTVAGDLTVLMFVRDVLLTAHREADETRRALKLRFVTRFQQFTGALMAKAVEDTAFFRYVRLLSLNEVGGDPRTFGISVADFHAHNERMAQTHPHSLLSTSTHDSKRSEDVRARIDVLSEIPGVWRLALKRWRRINERHKTRLKDELAPSGNDEYALYQTLIGIWPLLPMQAMDRDAWAQLMQRVQDYMLKFVREAKQRTSWVNPDPRYEQALRAFIQRIFAGGEASAFFSDFIAMQATVARFGACNSLAMLLLKLTCPGVPDIYQGCELWDFSLADPDNRRPVDFAVRADLLAGLQRDFPSGADAQALGAMWTGLQDSRIKLYVLRRVLSLRKQHEWLWRSGRYVALEVSGPAARHLVAFARILDGQACIVVVARLLAGLCGADDTRLVGGAVWEGTHIEIPPSLHERAAWREVLAGHLVEFGRSGYRHRLAASSVLASLPLAVLVDAAAGEVSS